MRYDEYEQIKKSKEAVIVYFKILGWNSPRQTEEKHEKSYLSLSDHPVTRPRFQPAVSHRAPSES
jgi:hypothetical protein